MTSNFDQTHTSFDTNKSSFTVLIMVVKLKFFAVGYKTFLTEKEKKTQTHF